MKNYSLLQKIQETKTSTENNQMQNMQATINAGLLRVAQFSHSFIYSFFFYHSSNKGSRVGATQPIPADALRTQGTPWTKSPVHRMADTERQTTAHTGTGHVLFR